VSNTKKLNAAVAITPYAPLGVALQTALPNVALEVRRDAPRATQALQSRPRVVLIDADVRQRDLGALREWQRSEAEDSHLLVLHHRASPGGLPPRSLVEGIEHLPVTDLATLRLRVAHLLGTPTSEPSPRTFRLVRREVSDEQIAWALVRLGAEHGLTSTELDVLATAVDIACRREAAEALGVSPHTHRKHVESLQRKCERSIEQLALDLWRDAYATRDAAA